jgi:hypothetical protein
LTPLERGEKFSENEDIQEAHAQVALTGSTEVCFVFKIMKSKNDYDQIKKI